MLHYFFFSHLLCVMFISLYLCCFCNWSLGCSVNTHINTGVSDRKNNLSASSSLSSRHVPNNNDKYKRNQTPVTWPHKMMRHVSLRTNFRESWRDTPSLQHINNDVNTLEHKLLYGLLSVSCAAHLKATRSALCRSNSSVHTELTVFQKGKTYFYLCTAF